MEKILRTPEEIKGLIDHLNDGTVTSIKPDCLQTVIRFLGWVIGEEPPYSRI